LAEADFEEIDVAARRQQRGVLACGNFALTVVLLQRFAEIAARYLDHFEVIDYAHEDKPDAPSGTARELAFRLGQVKHPDPGLSLDQVRGPAGAPGQRLHLAHHAGSSAEPYVDGTLLAIRKVGALKGVHRGLDSVMSW
jgi:4-hydroxy-tetrahydrodipicolinate reductase